MRYLPRFQPLLSGLGLILSFSACGFRVSEVPPQETLRAETPPCLRVTLRDGTAVHAITPQIDGDTLRGMRPVTPFGRRHRTSP